MFCTLFIFSIMFTKHMKGKNIVLTFRFTYRNCKLLQPKQGKYDINADSLKQCWLLFFFYTNETRISHVHRSSLLYIRTHSSYYSASSSASIVYLLLLLSSLSPAELVKKIRDFITTTYITQVYFIHAIKFALFTCSWVY